MEYTPTGYSMTYSTASHTCDRCGLYAANFTELYNPRDKRARTIYLCDSCQAQLCAHIGLFIQGGTQ